MKHDCSKVMEPTLQNDTLQNGQKKVVQIEEEMDFRKIVHTLAFEELTKTEQALNLPRYVTLSMYDAFLSP